MFLKQIPATLLLFWFGQPHVIAAAESVTAPVVVELTGSAVRSTPGQAEAVIVPGQALAYGITIRTLPLSRATVRMGDFTLVRLRELTTIQFLPPTNSSGKPVLNVISGSVFVSSREPPVELAFQTPQGRGEATGTGYEILLAGDRTIITTYDGVVGFTNAAGGLVLARNEVGIFQLGVPPQKVRLEARNTVQWWIFYPGVLEPGALSLTAEERSRLSASLGAYGKGDLRGAIADYKEGSGTPSAAENLYRAQLYLAGGSVEQAKQLITAQGANPQAKALETIIAAVNLQELPGEVGDSAAEQVAYSYWLQSKHDLEGARKAAQLAVERSINFGFGWERLAELEFSFGHTAAAEAALERSLEFAPANAQAHALRGFVLSARNKIKEATAEFNRAIELDSSLANAWLGRGLCRIRKGDARAGREDLQMAAALEPERSLLRSYLGKAFGNQAESVRAREELTLGGALDEKDPTPWLYLALLDYEENRIGEAVHALEKSIELNDNRAVYRSQFLLDEDRAVRSTSLANVYSRAGMTDVSIREAARAVTYDYANYSAHLFLSDSYDALRDPTRFNLRYETVWFNELLLANILAPVGGTPLSQHISQQEYARLFQQDRAGLSSSTEIRSDKQFHELASQFGAIGNTGWSLDLDYQHNEGIRVNNDLDRIEWYTTLKEQLTPQDSILFLLKYEDYHSGDNFQYYDPTNARPHFRFDEYQDPIALAAWHHEWQPGIDTMVLAGRLENEQRFRDQSAPQHLLFQDASGTINADVIGPATFDVDYHNQLEIYTAEVEQLFQWHRVALSFGARYQSGAFDTDSAMVYRPAQPPGLSSLFVGTPTNTASTDGFERITGYGYLTLEPLEHLWLSGGVCYDDLTYPRNFRNPPIAPGQDHRSQLGPKAALVWNPLAELTFRGIYTRSLGGVSLDESYRLEPTQLAGFPQTFRTLISESVVGSVSGPEYQTYGAAADFKFASGTYAGLAFERLESDVDRGIGVFLLPLGAPPIVPSSTRELLAYRENVVSASINQLLGDMFVTGTSYKFSQVQLHDRFPEIPLAALASANSTARDELHEVSAYVLFNHPSGFFGRAEANWYRQHNGGADAGLARDDFCQENVFGGYRFARNRAEVMVGLLNLSGQDYRLNPLSTYAELPRERAFYARVRFQF